MRRENVNSVGDKPITLPSVENHKSPMKISGMKMCIRDRKRAEVFTDDT